MIAQKKKRHGISIKHIIPWILGELDIYPLPIYLNNLMIQRISYPPTPYTILSLSLLPTLVSINYLSTTYGDKYELRLISMVWNSWILNDN